MGGGGLFAGYFRASLIYQGQQHVWKYGGAKKKNILMYVFLVDATTVDVVWKFWILTFLEALKTKFNDL